MEFLPPEIETYALGLTEPESPLLAGLNRETHAKVMMPRMLSGHLQGRLLSMFSRMIRPNRILEIGTYTGYSALCLAEGLAERGELHTIDVNDELKGMILQYVSSSPYAGKIHLHIGEAMKVIPGLEGTFDLVFIDADKENYSRYFELVFPRVNKGGWIIADNVLWSGKVVQPVPEKDTETAALKAYSKRIFSDPRVRPLLLPVRDGLMICQKISE